MTKDATDVALAFYYQGCYALVELLRATDDDAGIAVETYDDVVLEAGSLKTLSQLKHKKTSLSIKSDDFWKAVGNWVEYLGDPSLRFRFVLTSPLAEGSILLNLGDTTLHDSICLSLNEEANRIVNIVDSEKKKQRFKHRISACRAFLVLASDQQKDLIARLDIQDGSFNVSEYDEVVAAELVLIPASYRMKVVERVIEWWDRQVALSLSDKRLRVLRKGEVLENIAQANILYHSDMLPDDYANRIPPEELDKTPVLVRQIELVEGGEYFIERAKQERWKARGQRDSWLSEQCSVAERLVNFDKGLLAEWQDHFIPFSKQEKLDEDAEKVRGQELFKWAFHDAWQEVPPIQPEWRTPYLVRGTYQELANQRAVGWHPRFLELLEKDTVISDDE